MPMHVPNQFRVRTGRLATDNGHGNNGMFFIPNKCRKLADKPPPLRVVAADGSDAPPGADVGNWEHVSVSLPTRCPTWDEMCFIKELFWDDEDAVMQLHPPRSTWINNHPYTLHLWRPLRVAIPLPPGIAVGVQGLDPAQAEALTKYLGQ